MLGPQERTVGQGSAHSRDQSAGRYPSLFCHFDRGVPGGSFRLIKDLIKL